MRKFVMLALLAALVSVGCGHRRGCQKCGVKSEAPPPPPPSYYTPAPACAPSCP